MGDIGEQRHKQVAPDELDAEMPYIGLEHMPRRDITLSAWGAKQRVLPAPNSTSPRAMSYSASSAHTFTRSALLRSTACVSTDIVVLYPKDPDFSAWLLMHVSSDEFVAHSDRSSAGTKMPRTNWKDMAAFPVALPLPPVAAVSQDQVGRNAGHYRDGRSRVRQARRPFLVSSASAAERAGPGGRFSTDNTSGIRAPRTPVADNCGGEAVTPS